jgi:NaMN:DMB phosphoribosyltransferase
MGWTPDETWKRILGVLNALVVVVFANVIPKHATSPQGLSMLRAVGWALVLGGLGSALAWIFLPIIYAGNAAMAAMLAAMAFAVARVAWSAVRSRSAPPDAP